MYNYFMLVGILTKIADFYIVIKVQRPFKNADGKYDFDEFQIYVGDYLIDLVKETFNIDDKIIVKGRLRQNNWKESNLQLIAEQFINAK